MLQIFNDHLANFKINSKQIYISSRTENGQCIVWQEKSLKQYSAWDLLTWQSGHLRDVVNLKLKENRFGEPWQVVHSEEPQKLQPR